VASIQEKFVHIAVNIFGLLLTIKIFGQNVEELEKDRVKKALKSDQARRKKHYLEVLKCCFLELEQASDPKARSDA